MELDYKLIRKQFKLLLSKIKEYDRIVCYRHVAPDYDAFGSQMGMVYWIKANFPKKEVHFVGEENPRWCPDLYPIPEKLEPTWFEKGPFLAIITDVATTERISDDSTQKADFKIKIDHHPETDPYGDLNIVYPNIIAASEIVALFELSLSGRKYHLPKEAAEALYSGIVGDSSRFLYKPTDGATLRISADLIDAGTDIDAVYSKMYKKTMNDINNLKFVLNNAKFTKAGVCYYVLTDEDLQRLNIPSIEGKLYINQFRDVEGIEVCVSVTENKVENAYRVSIRSKNIDIDKIAQQFRGGGHEHASGAKLLSLDELPSLLDTLDKAILENKAKKE